MKIPAALRRVTLAQPIEVGTVSWGRELNDALDESSRSGKPVFALFQEVPGCSGCKQFGAEVLSNPVIVDAIEEAFVPLLIHNNTGGRDAEVLAQYKEPAWNFQVVRFLDSTGDDILPRRDRVWETGPLAQRMVATLVAAGREVPEYLRLIEQEHSNRLETIHFAQPCFWVGEMELGQIEGVVTTQAAFMGGHEITTVRFDPEATTAVNVAREAIARNVASVIYANDVIRGELAGAGIAARAEHARSHRIAPKSDQKRQIKGVSGLRNLSEAQLAKVNAFLRASMPNASKFLAPSQRSMLASR